ncbi:MAG: hypothetical protein VW599_11560 [Pseudomonadales bacterium]
MSWFWLAVRFTVSALRGIESERELAQRLPLDRVSAGLLVINDPMRMSGKLEPSLPRRFV